MFEVVPFDKEVLTDFIYNGDEREFSGEQIVPIVEWYAKLGGCYIGVLDGKVLCVGGIYPLWAGVGGCFLFLNKEARSHKKTIFKALAAYTNILVERYSIKDLIVECQSDNASANRLLEHLGFVGNRQVVMSVYAKRTGA